MTSMTILPTTLWISFVSFGRDAMADGMRQSHHNGSTGHAVSEDQKCSRRLCQVQLRECTPTGLPLPLHGPALPMHTPSRLLHAYWPAAAPPWPCAAHAQPCVQSAPVTPVRGPG